jgi:hypothetical protein
MSGFPDAKDRASILSAVASQLHVSPQLRQLLPAIAACAEAELFTGADLQAVRSRLQWFCCAWRRLPLRDYVVFSKQLMYSAQLEAAREAIDSQVSESVTTPSESRQPPVIELRHLQTAFATTPPSVPVKDRLMLTRLYESFRSGKPQGMLSGAVGNRVALK